MADDGASGVYWTIQRLVDGATLATAAGGVWQSDEVPPVEQLAWTGRRVEVEKATDKPFYAGGPRRSGAQVLVQVRVVDRNVSYGDMDNTIDAIDDDLDGARDFYVPGLLRVTCYKDSTLPNTKDPVDRALSLRGAVYRLVLQPRL